MTKLEIEHNEIEVNIKTYITPFEKYLIKWYSDSQHYFDLLASVSI